MDNSYRNPTRFSTINGGFTFRSFNPSPSLCHHNLSHRSLGPLGSYRSPCHPSIPSSSRQPPLLPLPGSKSTSALSPTKGTAMTIGFNQQKHQRRARPSASPRNGKAVLVRAQKSKTETWEEERGEREDAMESINSISPPPSSLPLPRFSVPRPKTAAPAASCVMEAMGGGEIDIGATDGLRRLLRL